MQYRTLGRTGINGGRETATRRSQTGTAARVRVNHTEPPNQGNGG